MDVLDKEQHYVNFIVNVYCPYYFNTRRDIATGEGAIALYTKDREVAEKEAELIALMGCCPTSMEVLTIPEPPKSKTDSIKLISVRRINRVMDLYQSVLKLFREQKIIPG